MSTIKIARIHCGDYSFDLTEYARIDVVVCGPRVSRK